MLDEAAGLFSASCDVEELHVTRMVGELEVAPWKSSSPQYIRQNHGYCPLAGIMMRQTGLEFQWEGTWLQQR